MFKPTIFSMRGLSHRCNVHEAHRAYISSPRCANECIVSCRSKATLAPCSCRTPGRAGRVLRCTPRVAASCATTSTWSCWRASSAASENGRSSATDFEIQALVYAIAGIDKMPPWTTSMQNHSIQKELKLENHYSNTGTTPRGRCRWRAAVRHRALAGLEVDPGAAPPTGALAATRRPPTSVKEITLRSPGIQFP